jgi:hypothetical protein
MSFRNMWLLGLCCGMAKERGKGWVVKVMVRAWKHMPQSKRGEGK